MIKLAKKVETKELLPAYSSDLKAPEQCAYREGRLFRDGNLIPSKDATCYKGQITIYGAGLIDFALGILGKPPNVTGYSDFCHDGCKLFNCNYNTQQKSE